MDKFTVHLFGNYAGEKQFSMLRYADQLKRALEDGYADQCTLRMFAPPTGAESSSKAMSYWQRYIAYPRLARRNPGFLNHITDHSNAHLLGALAPERTVVTCHDLMMLRARRGLEGGHALSRWRFAWTEYHLRRMQKAAHIIVDSEQTRRDVVEFLGIAPASVTTIFPGVDPQKFSPVAAPEEKIALRKELGFPWRWTLLQVGSHFFYKNTEGVLKTLALLRRRLGSDVHLVTVGSAWTDGQQAQIRSLGLSDAVHALGPVSDDRLRQIYNAADVLFYPSWWEGFGWPPLEAMACGLPVVASARGSLAEVLGTAAARVDPANENEMADVLQRVLEDTAIRNDLIQKGKDHVSRFTWDATARQVLQVYRRVATMLS